MERKYLTTEKEIEHFNLKFSHIIGVKLPLPYLTRGKVVAFFKDGQLIGGFVIVDSPEFRGISFIPDEVKRSSPFIQSVSQSKMAEVNGIFLEDSASYKESLYFWIVMALEINKCKRKYVVCFYDKRNKGIGRWYEKVGAKVIYQGPPNLAGGTSHSEMWIGYIQADIRLLINPKLYWKFMKKILLRRKRVVPALKERGT